MFALLAAGPKVYRVFALFVAGSIGLLDPGGFSAEGGEAGIECWSFTSAVLYIWSF